MTRPIRLGLLLDSCELARWEYVLLDRLMRSRCASIDLVVLNAGPTTRPGLVRRVLTNWRYLVFAVYTRLDARLFDVQPNAFATTDAAALLQEVPSLSVTPVSTKFSDRFDPEDILAIGRYDLDLLLRFGFRILRGDILTVARHGVWSYHHGDNRVNRGGPAGFWEVFEQWDTTGSILQILSEDLDAGKVLYRSTAQTDKRSVHRNRNTYYWKSVSFVPRVIRKLHDAGSDAFLDSVEEQNRGVDVYSSRLFTVGRLTNLKMLALLTTHGLRLLRDMWIRACFVEQWTLFYAFTNRAFPMSLRRFTPIVPPRDRFFADPFPVQHDHRHYIFIEEYVYRSRKGHISVIEVDANGHHRAPVTVLDAPHHLSYPFIVKHGDDYFMIPESGNNRTIDIYRCLEFPFKWEFHMHLMEGVEAYDATLFFHDRRWWLFATMVEQPGASSLDELFLFHAPALLTTAWTPHPLNPIVSDVRRARPAGAVFIHEGRIVRPAQDSSKRYGRAITLHEIRTLNEREYEEVELQSIEPHWAPRLVATHTLNRGGRLTVVDGNIQRSRLF